MKKGIVILSLIGVFMVGVTQAETLETLGTWWNRLTPTVIHEVTIIREGNDYFLIHKFNDGKPSKKKALKLRVKEGPAFIEADKDPKYPEIYVITSPTTLTIFDHYGIISVYKAKSRSSLTQ